MIPGTTETAGLRDDISTGIWASFLEATANGADFPGAIVSWHYDHGFGSHFGILRAIGSYETQSSSPYDFGYLYDGAAGSNGNLTTLVYPSTARARTPFPDSSRHIRQPDRIRSPIGQSAENPKITCKPQN